MYLEVPQQISSKNFEKWASFVTFCKIAEFLLKFLEKVLFLTKISIKWVIFGQLTPQMALLKAITSVLDILRLKLDIS